MSNTARILVAWLALAMPLQAREPAPATVRAGWILGQELFVGGESLGRIENLLIERAYDRVASLAVAVPGEPSTIVSLRGAWLRARSGGGLELQTPRGQPPGISGRGDEAAARRATEVMDAELHERDGTRVAEVNDFTVRLDDGAVVHLVVKFDPDAYQSDGEVALPIGSVEPKGAHFVARFDASKLRPVSGAAAKAAAAPAARLSRLVGMRVVDRDGGEAGRVADVVMAPDGSKVTHLLVTPSTGGDEIAYPLAQARARRAGASLLLEVDATRLAALSRSASRPRPGAMLGSRLLGSQVVAPAGGDVGDLHDAVVNLHTGALHLVVARFKSDWVKQGLLVAMRPRPLRPLASSGDLAMQVGLNELNAAYLFPEARWPNMNDPAVRAEIDRHLR